jgi:hypothetical protein
MTTQWINYSTDEKSSTPTRVERDWCGANEHTLTIVL